MSEQTDLHIHKTWEESASQPFGCLSLHSPFGSGDATLQQATDEDIFIPRTGGSDKGSKN